MVKHKGVKIKLIIIAVHKNYLKIL